MRFTIHQPMIFAPIYLWGRFATVRKLVTLGEDWAKQDGWHTRFQLMNSKGSAKYTLPVPLKDRFGKRIDEVEFHEPEKFFRKLEKTLRMNYGSAPFLDFVLALIDPGDHKESFGVYCTRVTEDIANYLCLDLEVINVAKLGLHRPASASRWLAEIGTKIGGTTYVCAADATQKYLSEEPFQERGIAIEGQDFGIPGMDATVSILHLLLLYSNWKVKGMLEAADRTPALQSIAAGDWR